MSLATFTDAEVKHGVYVLAEKAEVHSPDNLESPGARLLTRAQDEANDYDADALLEGIRSWVAEGNDAEDYGVNDLPNDVRDDLFERADSCVQIYTYPLWQEFVDLCLYEEDVSDLMPDVSDLTKVAMAAQQMVAERLLGVLLAERSVLLAEANPVDEFAHDDAENDVIHLEDVEHGDLEAIKRHLVLEHGVDPQHWQKHADLDATHRSLDHSDLAGE